jgi:hypothetical protein
MLKTRFLLTCMMAVALVAGCGPRRDVAARVQAGDSIGTISISGFTNGVPIAFTISDTQSLRFVTEGIRSGTDSWTPGNVFEAHIRLASGYSEKVMLMVKEGGDEISFGTGAGLLREPSWHTMRVGQEAPASLATNLFYLGKAYK